MTPIDTVVCVHGLWSRGAGMYLIKRRLEREYGFRVLLFDYPSVRGTLDENAARLARFILEQDLEATHILAHSLGGVIGLRMLATEPDAVPGRIVCAGSPLTGSRAAEFLIRQDWAEPIIGNTLKPGVVHASANEWASHVCKRREVGIIAGTVRVGLGQFVADVEEPNDGTVAVSETRLEGARDHICLPVSHYSMLLAPAVADQAAAFFKRGEFLRDL